MMRFNLILAALAAVLAVPTYLTIARESQRFTDFDSVPRLFDGFTPETVRFVVLSRRERDDNGDPIPAEGEEPAPEERLVLVRDENVWRLGDGPLAGVEIQSFDDESKVVSDILEHVGAVRRDEKALVAVEADDERLARAGLTPELGTLIQCFDAEQRPIAEMYVGADASGGKYGQEAVRGRFVRAKDNKAIVLYEADYWDLSLDADAWIEKLVHDFETSKVAEFGWSGPHGSVRFVRKDEDGARWTCPEPPPETGAVRQQEVDNLLARFNRLYCERYLPPSELQGIDSGLDPKPQIEVEAVLHGGRSYTLAIGSKIADKNEYYALASESPNFPIALGDWNRTPFEREIVEFFDPPAPAGEGEDAGKGGEGGDEGQPGEGKSGDGKSGDGEGGQGSDPKKSGGQDGEGQQQEDQPPQRQQQGGREDGGDGPPGSGDGRR